MRAIGVPCAANQAISASGSQATLASFKILPCASTMHTLALSNDTSMPAYCSMVVPPDVGAGKDRKSTRLNSSHANISYAVFCLKKKTTSHFYDHPFIPLFPVLSIL